MRLKKARQELASATPAWRSSETAPNLLSTTPDDSRPKVPPIRAASPAPVAGSKFVGGTHIYQKVRDRASYAFALISVAAVIQPGGRGRLAFGGLAHKPWRVEAAEAQMPQWRQGDRIGGPRRRPHHITERVQAAVGRTHHRRRVRRRKGLIAMKFDTPATANPTDRMKVLGQPLDRVDGKLKTTGTAHYAYERNDVAPNAAYGYILGAAIAKGRIESIDTADAKAAPGVLAVVTYAERRQARQGARTTPRGCSPAPRSSITTRRSRSSSPRRSSRHAPPPSWSASTTRATPGQFDLAAAKSAAATKPQGAASPDTAVGDFDGRFAAAPVKLDAALHHARPEPRDDGAARHHRRVEGRQAHASGRRTR